MARFDRSSIDILLNGHFWSTEVRPTRQDANIRSDPTMLPVTMVRVGSEEYKLFSLRKKLGVIPTKLPYQRRLPAWLPARTRWPLEDFLSRFLGDVQQSAWLLRVELSWPHSHRWFLGAGIHIIALAVFIMCGGCGSQSVLAGAISGALYGMLLRIRIEKRFEWGIYGIPLLASCLLVLLTFNSAETLPCIQGWTVKELLGGLWDPLGRILGILKSVLLICVTVALPFMLDRKALVYENDAIIGSFLLLVLVYASNIILPLGVWYGALLKVVRDQIIPPPPVNAVGQQMTTAAAGGQYHQQQQQILQPSTGYSGSPSRSNVVGAGGSSSASGGFVSPRPPGGPGSYGLGGRGTPRQGYQQEQQVDLVTQAMRYAPDAGHPKRWLTPHASPYSQDYGTADLYHRRRSFGGGGPPGRPWTAQSPNGLSSSASATMDRYGLRSRRVNTRSSSTAAPAAAAMEMAPTDDDSPPPVNQSMRSPQGLYGEGRVPGDGLGRYTSMTPNRYHY